MMRGNVTRVGNLGACNKAKRAIWHIVWFLLYRTSPVSFHFWRRFLLRIFGAEIGSAAHPYPTAKIWAPWNLKMGDRSCLGPGVDCYSAAQINIGKDAVVSQRAYLCSASHDYHDPKFPLVIGDIFVGEGCWVAAEAFVGPGVDIGSLAVVGARAVVTKSVEPRMVVAGNPAVVIGTR